MANSIGYKSGIKSSPLNAPTPNPTGPLKMCG